MVQWERSDGVELPVGEGVVAGGAVVPVFEPVFVLVPVFDPVFEPPQCRRWRSGSSLRWTTATSRWRGRRTSWSQPLVRWASPFWVSLANE